MKMNCVLFRIKINQKSCFCVFKISNSHSSYFVLYLHQWNILTSFLIMNCLLSFVRKLIDHKLFSNIFTDYESTFRWKSFPSLVFILLVPLTSFGSTEQRHCNLIRSIIRLTLVSFGTSLKQITISLSQ